MSSSIYGGYFKVDKPDPKQKVYQRAVSFSSGRACLRALIQERKPDEVHIPFYICDTALEPFNELEIPIKFYDVEKDLTPGSLPILRSNSSMFIWVNYFGSTETSIKKLWKLYGKRLVIDDTQAFFVGTRKHNIASFNSARKFFGVPDGAFLFNSDFTAMDMTRHRSDAGVLHLVEDGLSGLTGYRANEALVGKSINEMSPISSRLLTKDLLKFSKRRRKRNHKILANKLRKSGLEVLSNNHHVPSHCVILSEDPVSWEMFYKQEIFAPQFWSGIETRPGYEKFPNSVFLSKHLIPLPVDHRYSTEDMNALAGRVIEIFSGRHSGSR